MKTVSKESAPLEQFMHETEELEPELPVSHHFNKGTVLVLVALIIIMVAAGISILNFANGLQRDRQERQEVMNSIAAKIPAAMGWEEESSSSPSLDKSKVFNKAWKAENVVNLDEAAGRLGVPMTDMAYPDGCKEGESGEFYIQLCTADMGKTVSVIID